MEELRYNFVVYNIGEQYFQPLFGVLAKHPNVVLRPYGIPSKSSVLKLLFKLHFSAKVNRVIKLPFKSIWYRSMAKHDFEKDLPVCYVFGGGKYAADSAGFLNYLKKKEPDCKTIIYFADLISKKHYRDVKGIINSVDAVCTYDSGEAEQYGIFCYPNHYFSALLPITQPKEFLFDVYFIGYAKDRLERIYKAYRTLTNMNLRCKFVLAGVAQEDRIEGEGLNYGNISYLESVENVQNSRCILEIVQGGAKSCTNRILEAIAYRRKLLSDGEYLRTEELVIPQVMRYFSDEEEIDMDFVRSDTDYSAFEGNKMKSPEQFLTLLQNFADGKGCNE